MMSSDDEVISDNGLCEEYTQSDESDDVKDKEEKFSFNPPLYCQRYDAVINVIKKCHDDGNNIINLLDVGCAECKFVKRAVTVPFLENIYGLDIDRELLEQKYIARRLEPLITDLLLKRKRDLLVKVYAGSVAECDPGMLRTDAVSAIEIIEHLHPPVLKGFVEMVFSYIRPKLVIVTTPNSEFNVLFPNFSGMRHWDHKFEWTRAQFQEWGDDICSKHGYTVTYDGVGNPPETSSQVGHCSQMAVFVRSDDAGTSKGSSECMPTTQYEEIFSTTYPGHNQTEEQLLDNDIHYYLNTISHSFIQENYIEDLTKTPILIETLLSSTPTLSEQLNMTTLAARLDELDYRLSEDRQCVLMNMEAQESEPEEEDDNFYREEVDRVSELLEPEPLWG